MSEAITQENGQTKKQRSSHILRDRIGGVPTAAQEMSREHVKIKKQIKKVLRERPHTVPEISEATNIPVEKVLWHLMSLRKYGEIVDGEEKGSYLEYVFKSKKEKSS